ncbi:phospholipase A2 inhibitor beta-like [Thunnus thynnus]|uniref:phospholipase A2 inhibitor beta-like n=1 Tax=Thunnus thynnus TaxID=8237 RepID=UPI003528E310
MKVVAVLALLVVNLRLSRCCYGEGPILLCLQIPQAFSPGYSTLVMILKDVGEINSTALRSDDLTSVTRLKIADARVTGVAARAFSSFQNLTSLHLEQNLLTEISPSWFSRPSVLHELNLTQNLIEVLNESMLNGFTGLSRLSLNKNRIRTIDPNSFNLLTNLAELDLSDNRMTKVSPQVFGSLNSTRMRLDENPWDCSCEAEEFVDFLKDLQSRSLLKEEMKVTCESPPSLKSRPVWNVSVCVTSPPPGPSAGTKTSPTDVPAPTLLTGTFCSFHPSFILYLKLI